MAQITGENGITGEQSGGTSMESIIIFLVVIFGLFVVGLGFLLPWEVIGVVVAVFLIGFGFGYIIGRVVGVTYQDVSFESSDGLWTYRTYISKGLGLEHVLRQLEEHKFIEGNMDIEIFRVTRKPKCLSLLWTKEHKNNPVWTIPYRPSIGLSPDYSVGRDNREGFSRIRWKREEIHEITKRTKIAIDYWNRKSKGGEDC